MLNLNIEPTAPAYVVEAIDQTLAVTQYMTDDVARLNEVADFLRERFAGRNVDVAVVARTLAVKRTTVKGSSLVATILRDRTPAELTNEYAAAKLYAVKQLRARYEDGRAACAAFVEKARLGQQMYVPGALTYEIRWGTAVSEDIAASYAARLLEAVDAGLDVHEAVRLGIEDLRREANSSECKPTSTNPFSNAVAVIRRDVCLNLADRLTFVLRTLDEARAQMEVL